MSEYIRTDLKIKQADGSFLKYSPTVTLDSVIMDDGSSLSEKITNNGDNYSGTAAKANSVPWSGITNKPTTLEELGITGIVSNKQLESHINNTNNPHKVNKTQIGLENVDNTSDLNKPISNATQEALNARVLSLDVVETPIPNKILKLDNEGKINIDAIPQHVEIKTYTLDDI